MEPEGIRDLYDAGYAAAYDDRFLTGPAWARSGSDFEVEVIGELLGGGPWLDVACGTGWFLSQFPDEDRSGLDLSPAMVSAARRANGGIDVFEGSYLDPHPEWEGAWSLVTCMWLAYAYVDTVAQVEEVFANLARWTAADGSLFVPVSDLVDLTGGIQVPYRNDEVWSFGGPLSVVGVVWSWTDEAHDKTHERLVCPHVDHLVGLLGRWFETVEVVFYPPLHPKWGGRRGLIARSKRPQPGSGPPCRVTSRVEPYRGDEPLEVEPPANAAPEPEPVEQLDGGEGEATDPSGATEDPLPQGGVWGVWWRLPLSVRRSLRRIWAKVPAGARRSLGARVASSGDSPTDPGASA